MKLILNYFYTFLIFNGIKFEIITISKIKICKMNKLKQNNNIVKILVSFANILLGVPSYLFNIIIHLFLSSLIFKGH